MWTVDGSAIYTVPGDVVAASFRDARGETGSGTLTLPLHSVYTINEDQTLTAQELLAQDLVVKHVLDGVDLFAWVIEEDVVELVNDLPVVRASGRGILCWLEWGTIYPAGGLRRRAPRTRYFGFGASNIFTGGLGSTFAPALTASRSDVPPDWPAATLTAMWPTDPDSLTTPGDTQAWFYDGWVEASGGRFRIDATGDDSVEVWIDDEKVITYGGRDKISPATTGSATWKGILAPGTHWIMAKGRQIDSESLADLGVSSPAYAYVAVRVARISSDTDTGTEVDLGAWSSTLVEPGWNAGLSLKLVLNEAANRSVDRIYWTSHTFTNDVDENGVDLPHRVNRTWPVGTDLLAFVMELMEAGGVDIWASPDKVLHMAVTRGEDKTESVRLSPGQNLPSYGVVRKHRVRTRALISTADGWTQATNTDAEAIHGTAETRIDLGSVDSLVQAQAFAAAELEPLAWPTRQTSGEQTRFLPVEGSRPYLDFGVADLISAPDGAGAYTDARVLALSWRKADPDEWSAELDLAQRGARRVAPATEQRLLSIAQSGGAASAGGTIQSASK